jgi:acetyl-CoA synthetase
MTSMHYGFVILKKSREYRDREKLTKEINQQVSNQIGLSPS